MDKTTHLVAVFTILFCGSALAQGQMKLRVHADPSDQASSANITAPFGDRLLADAIPVGGAEVTLPAIGVKVSRSAVFIKWKDGDTSSFPIYISSAFPGEEIKFYFSSARQLSDPAEISAECMQNPPTVEEMFKMFFACRLTALGLEQTDRWTKKHLTALNGWLIGNKQLYDRATPMCPYGADPDLVERLAEVVAEIDQKNFRAADFAPLRVSDAREFLRRVEEEDIRLAGFVPTLVQEGRFTAAQAANALASQRYEANFGAEVSVDGVTRGLLNSNRRLLDSLVR